MIRMDMDLVPGHVCPRVYCDACDQPITDPGMAWVMYDPADEPRPAVLFAHKGRCIRHLEATHDNYLWSSEFREFHNHLAHNTQSFPTPDWVDPIGELVR